MQVLITTGTTAGTQPIYLPYDKAPVPFGDPLAATATSGTTSVITVPGYNPTQNDAVSFTYENAGTGVVTLSTIATLTTFAQPGITYYVTPAGGQTFTLSTGKSTSTAGITTQSAINTALNATLTTSTLIVHMLSNQVDGTTIPFKPGNTVLAMNAGSGQLIGTNSYANITLFGAPDLTTVYGNPIGPGTYSVIATVGFGAPKLVTINYDWIVASGSTSTLVLLQN
jgi:hypothetical protein